MKQHDHMFKLVAAALLCAIGILIPVVSPVKVSIPPASFTLASHVAIFVAMFLSPGVTAAVCIGTTLGFQLAGFPLVVVARAASQIVFAVLGACWLQKRPGTLRKAGPAALFGLAAGAVHALLEVLVVLPFYVGGGLSEANYTKGFFMSVVVLVGFGTVVHSMVDYYLALLVYKPVSRLAQVQRVSTVGKL